MDRQAIIEEVKTHAKDGKISCKEAFNSDIRMGICETRC